MESSLKYKYRYVVDEPHMAFVEVCLQLLDLPMSYFSWNTVMVVNLHFNF